MHHSLTVSLHLQIKMYYLWFTMYCHTYLTMYCIICIYKCTVLFTVSKVFNYLAYTILYYLQLTIYGIGIIYSQQCILLFTACNYYFLTP